MNNKYDADYYREHKHELINEYEILLTRLQEIFKEYFDENPDALHYADFNYKAWEEYEKAFWCIGKYYSTVRMNPDAELRVEADISTLPVRLVADCIDDYRYARDFDEKYFVVSYFDEGTVLDTFNSFSEGIGDFWSPLVFTKHEKQLGQWLADAYNFIIPIIDAGSSWVNNYEDITSQMKRNKNALWRVVSVMNRKAYIDNIENINE